MGAALAVERIDGRVGISAMWIAEHGIRSVSALQQMEHRGKIVPLNRGCRNTPKVYEYRTLPEAMKQEIDRLVNVYENARHNLLEQYIEHDADLRHYFDEYRTAKGQYLPNSQQNPVRDTYYYNGIILSAIQRMITDPSNRDMGWEQVTEYVRTLDRIDFPFSLPENSRKLRDKVREFDTLGAECLIHKNYRSGSSNATKVMEGEQRSMMIALISEHRNFDCEEIAKLYNQWAQAHGWKTITGSLVRTVQKQTTFITTASKHGAEAFRNSLSVTVKRKAPSEAMYMWVLDGWDAELMYQKKDSKGRTTYHNRLTLEVVLDASKKYIIGWAVGESESAELIREALRNAERHVEELTGQMLKPFQLQMDNFAKKALQDTYDGLAQYVTPARVGNAKSKIIEPWFREFNDKHCKYAFNWSGHGVTASKRNQPNLDITLANKKNIPTLDEVVDQIAAIVGSHRAATLPAYTEAIAALPEADRLVLTMKEYLSLFGELRQEKYSLQSTGINMRVLGERHQYDMLPANNTEEAVREAIRFREHCWEKWNVRYDPNDYSHILVENDQKTEQYVLTVKDVQPMALKDRKPGDYERLDAIRKFNKVLEAHVAKELCSHQASAIEQIQQEKRDYEMLSKALITDSNGQHKSVKAAARLAAATDAFVAAEEVQEESLYDLL